ncbi:MAG: potassium channel family protein [Cyanobacteria bacterium J06635_15]
MVATLDANAFSTPLAVQDSYLKALHFSFTTLTTLGYGDIVPISEIALVLTNLEAIIGQMYPAIFIAILVGNYLFGHSKE